MNDRWDGAVIQAKLHGNLRVNWALRLIELMDATVRAGEALVDEIFKTGKTVFYAQENAMPMTTIIKPNIDKKSEPVLIGTTCRRTSLSSSSLSPALRADQTRLMQYKSPPNPNSDTAAPTQITHSIVPSNLFARA